MTAALTINALQGHPIIGGSIAITGLIGILYSLVSDRRQRERWGKQWSDAEKRAGIR